MRKILPFLSLFLLPYSLLAQSRLSDSLAAELAKVKTDSERVELHYQLGRQFFLSDVKKGIEQAELAKKVATESGNRAGEANALNLLGYAEVILGEYDKALNFYFQALKISEEIGATDAMTVSYNSIGTVYHRIKDNERAIRYYKLSLDLANKNNNKLGMSKVYNNVGNIYEDNKEYQLSLTYFKKAATLQEELNHKGSWAISLYNIGNTYLNLEHPEQGLPYLFHSLRLNRENGNKMIMVGTLRSISSIYLKLGQQEKALSYADQSYQLAIETESSKKISDAALLMQQVYAAKGDYKKAHQYLTTYVEQQKKLDIESQRKVTDVLTVQYETEKKELENQKLKAENENHLIEMKHQQLKQAFGVVLSLLMLGLVVVLEVNRRRVKEKNKELQDINRYVQAKSIEIENQKSEISAQANTLKIQNKELEQTSNFKNKLFSIISHDLRNPFYSIKGILGMMQRKSLQEEDIRHVFNLLNRDVEVAQNMLHNLLLWSKAQLDGSFISMKPLNLHQLTAENLELLTSQAEEKNLCLVNQVPDPTMILADEDRLNFILRNLLSNAVKFSYPDGEVAVTTSETEGAITVSVTDHGKGISEANVAKLFTNNRFTTPGTAKEKGSGLGLMFSKDFVESMGGQLQLQSELNKGSTFSVTLQRSEVATPDSGAVNSASPEKDESLSLKYA